MFFVLKLQFTKKSCLFSSLERFWNVSRVHSRTLIENLLVCGVLSSSHRGTPHTIGAKPHVYDLSHFEDLIRFKKYFRVYPALLRSD